MALTNGLVAMTPTSIAHSGTSASVNADGSVLFSAVTSLSLNGVFTADYDNYMVVTRFDAPSTASMFMRLRTSGTDTTSGYTYQYYWFNGTGIQVERASTTHFGGAYSYGGNGCGYTSYIYGPYLSQPTVQRTVGVADYQGASVYDYSATHSDTTQFDSITFLGGLGSIAVTGLVTIFGFNQ